MIAFINSFDKIRIETISPKTISKLKKGLMWPKMALEVILYFMTIEVFSMLAFINQSLLKNECARMIKYKIP